MTGLRDRSQFRTTALWGLPALLLPLLVSCSSAPEAREAYLPRTRELTVTTVPLLSKELRPVYPFLARDFADGGVLAGKEVYAFVPSTLTVVEGDTIAFVFVNPEDDVHSFVLPDLVVPLPPQSVTRATYVARRAGLYTFTCSVASHLPYMWGQLVVLAPGAVTSPPTPSSSASPQPGP
jgi:plastocyanin